jgi:hypothetical protein
MSLHEEVGEHVPEAERRVKIEVLVNDQRVVFDTTEATGAEIEAAAIKAGVPIEADFVLSEVLDHGKQRIIAGNEDVRLEDGDEFWAIPGDDNS